jgi:hypothetical protein
MNITEYYNKLVSPSIRSNYITNHNIIASNECLSINIENNIHYIEKIKEYYSKEKIKEILDDKYNRLFNFIKLNSEDYDFILLQECDIDFEKKLIDYLNKNNQFYKIAKHKFNFYFYNLTLYKNHVEDNFNSDDTEYLTYTYNEFYDINNRKINIINVRYKHEFRSTIVRNYTLKMKNLNDEIGTKADPIYNLLIEFNEQYIYKIIIGGDFNNITVNEYLKYRHLTNNKEIDIIYLERIYGDYAIQFQLKDLSLNETISKFKECYLDNKIEYIPIDLYSLEQYKKILTNYKTEFKFKIKNSLAEYEYLLKSDDKIYLFMR